ncbi:ATP-binding cassette domain-containing protein [candidate division KSB1 bacterium]|nr:ATP-binding cassette domain-containing protein [candidate division KSB1 bacterium]
MKVELKDVHFAYTDFGGGEHPVLNGISLTIEGGQFVGLVGRSGAGKTTLVKLFNGLLTPQKGVVKVDGINIAGKEADILDVRRRIGLAFQFPESQFFAGSVYDEVAFGPRNFGLNDRELDLKIRRALEMVGLDFVSFVRRSCFTLSYGEQRRVALASILVMEPELLILDEPTVGLDWGGTKKIEGILRKYHTDQRTILLISQDLEMVARLAQRVIVIKNGHISFDGSPNFMRGIN